MSLIGSVYAESAAKEILDLIRQKKQECQQNPIAVKALDEIEKRAEDIHAAAKAGYY